MTAIERDLDNLNRIAKKCIELYSLIYNVKLKIPEVRINNRLKISKYRGMTLAQYKHENLIIEVSPNIVEYFKTEGLKESKIMDTILDVLIPHEVAHSIVDQLFSKIVKRHHGKEWKSVAYDIGVLNPSPHIYFHNIKRN